MSVIVCNVFEKSKQKRKLFKEELFCSIEYIKTFNFLKIVLTSLLKGFVLIVLLICYYSFSENSGISKKGFKIVLENGLLTSYCFFCIDLIAKLFERKSERGENLNA